MKNEISRRNMVRGALTAAALLPGLASVLPGPSAADLAPVDPEEPTAKALGFVPHASKVNPGVYPTFKPGQRCATCVQYQAKPTNGAGPCSIFAGRPVPSEGWCQVWVQRPSS
jgi:hypothetical protein